MGRAETRIKERNKRIAEKKETIPLTRAQLGAWKERVEQQVSNRNVESLMTCFAMALYKHHMYSQEEITDIFYKIDDLMGAVVNEEATIEDYKKEMAEAGIIVQAT